MKMENLTKVAAAAFLAAALAAPLAAQQDLGEGSLQIKSEGAAEAPRILPLKSTDVKARISGFVADVEVTQVFQNPAEKPIEAVYVFPLPENAAVNEMTLTVADRVIKGLIKKRAEAKEIYEKAKLEGKTAALLDQERPNIFTQSVANIPPGQSITVKLRYLQTLKYEAKVYTFVFPMVVGPRYIPKGDAVPDAGRITPPPVRPGARPGRNITLTVRLDAGIAVQDIKSKSHDVSVDLDGDTKAAVTLSPEDSIPNKDFILTYQPKDKPVQTAVLAHKTGPEGYLTLMIQPKADFPLSQITPKELVFALDVSGSMSGFPVETSKELARHCLDQMNPQDTFQILAFSAGNRLVFDKPQPNTPENVARAREAINSLSGGGGTEMLDAIRQVLEAPKDPARLRIVLFMTDGFIGNESQILAYVREHLNNSRIFPLGVGSAPNRYLLEELAVMGKGSVQYVRQDERQAKLEKVISGFYDRIAKPYLTDLSVDWNGLKVLDPSPLYVPDLFAGQPVFIHGRYETPGKATITLQGKLNGKAWSMPVEVDLPDQAPKHEPMGPLWARSRITELERQCYQGKNETVENQITELALKHKLVSRFTSFVAVDETPTVAKGQKPMVVPVEAPIPEGTVHEGFFGGAAVSAVRGAGGSSGMYQNMAAPAGASEASGRMYKTMRQRRPDAGQPIFMPGPATPPVPARTQAPAMVDKLARELLAAPSASLARKLIALQDAQGAFHEPGADAVKAAEQALALLALAKARSALGSDIEEALNLAWSALKAQTSGADCASAVKKALQDGGLWKGYVIREYEALTAVLKAIK
ncbi:MAG: VIT domain-containing protein [Elusimicrobia bacterium]|nr:VIT domain-containing protein [Elusimicrobiota bacterium]